MSRDEPLPVEYSLANIADSLERIENSLSRIAKALESLVEEDETDYLPPSSENERRLRECQGHGGD